MFDDALEFIELMIKRRIYSHLLIVHSVLPPMPDGVTPYAHAPGWRSQNRRMYFFRGIPEKKDIVFHYPPFKEFYEHWRVRETTEIHFEQAYLKNLQSETYGPWEKLFITHKNRTKNDRQINLLESYLNYVGTSIDDDGFRIPYGHFRLPDGKLVITLLFCSANWLELINSNFSIACRKGTRYGVFFGIDRVNTKRPGC